MVKYSYDYSLIGENHMFIEERHAAILRMLEENGSITTHDIQKNFNVSYDSAKRDLRILEEQGRLKRTHGGAIPKDENFPEMPRRTNGITAGENAPYVCVRALDLISEGDTVYIPGGEIGAYIAKNLSEDCRLSVVTNSIQIAEMLRRRGGVDIIMLGGAADSDGMCTDFFTVEMLKKFRIDRAFITSDMISPTFGISLESASMLPFLSALIEHSASVVGLYPQKKVGGCAAFSVCHVSKLDVLITDAVLGEAISEYKKQGVKRIICL